MNKTRLAAAITLSALTVSVAHSAQYRVVELDVSNKGQNTFPIDINASGEIAVNVVTPNNPPIDETLLNFELPALIANLTDIEAAKIGNYNDADYIYLHNEIANSRESLTVQQIARNHAYLVDDNANDFIPGFDVLDEQSSQYTFSNDTTVRGVNDLGSTVGISFDPFYTLDYTLEDGTDITYVINDFYSRAFAYIDGNAVELPPIDATIGGKSVAYDININNQVVGYSTTLMSSPSLQTAIDNCADEETRGDQPQQVCIRKLQSAANNSGTKTLEFSFQRRGTIWQLDDQGSIISTKELGLLYSPEEDDERIFFSRAIAINDNGIAIGDSQDEQRVGGRIGTFAAVFNGDQVTAITNNDEYFSSTATDINNAGLVVGQGFKTVNGTTRSKFFVHDINSGETIFPIDFFVGSSSVANGINNAGIVVGKGEVENSITSRRSEAFLYDHNTAELQNLNALVACESGYTLVDAAAINDDNVIAATALIRAPAQNILGQNIVDDNGDEVLIDKLVAVRLEPIAGGTIDDCEVDPDDLQNNDRQGAGFGILSLLTLVLVGWRRRG